MNEAEAKKKACPLAKYFAAADNHTSHCLGSECMAWRAYDSDSGYCGMAGPEPNTTERRE